MKEFQVIDLLFSRTADLEKKVPTKPDRKLLGCFN